MRRVAFVMLAAGLPAAFPCRGAESAPAPVPAPVAAQPADPKVYFSGNDWFTVAADRVGAANYVSGVADRVAAILVRNGFGPEGLRPGKITVYVNSGDGAPEVVTDEGQTLVRIPLPVIPAQAVPADLERDREVARALAQGALSRLAQSAGKKPAPTDWVVEAVAWESQLSVYPGLLEWLVRASAEQGPGAIERLDESGLDRHGSPSRASLILFRALREASGDGFRVVVANAAMGRPVTDCVASGVPAVAKDRTALAAWWPAAFYREIDRRPAAVATPHGSARRFAELSRFVVYETPPGEKEARDIVLDAEGLIARRGDNAVTASSARRIVEIKAELLRANPVWFNTLRDYGVFLERLPVASPEELRKLSFDVMAEAKIAENLTGEIERALHGSS